MTNEHKLEPVAWLLYHPANRLSMSVVERTEDYRLSDGSVVYTSSPLVLKSAAEAHCAALREALHDLVRDLEMRSKWKEGADQGVVDCGNGVYMKAKAALGEL